MPNYAYQATDATGVVTKGTLRAIDAAALHEQLRQKNLLVVKYNVIEERSRGFTYKFKTKPLAIFTRSLASMLTAGVSLVKSMYILVSTEDNKACKELLRNIYEDLQRGTSFSESLQSHRSNFPNLFISMVAAGEASGNLDNIVERVSEHYASEAKTQNTIKKAMTYPIILAILMFVVIMLMFGFIMPIFRDLAPDPEAIPPLSKVLFGFSDFIRERWYVVVGAIVVIILGARLLNKLPGFRLLAGKIKLTMPKVGKLMKTIYTSRFARTMSNLFASGLQMIDCIEKSVDVLGNPYISLRFQEVLADVKKGETLSGSMEKVNIFDTIFVATVLIGEEAGQLDAILAKSADYYEEEAETAIQNLVAMLEPLMIVVLGIAVGLVLAGVFPMLYGSIAGLAA
ncbi:pilus biosynthesis protein PilC [Clostridia bacterium]|nr:pilus biosynthesis protein PilC [Clostridia bacterium]